MSDYAKLRVDITGFIEASRRMRDIDFAGLSLGQAANLLRKLPRDERRDLEGEHRRAKKELAQRLNKRSDGLA